MIWPTCFLTIDWKDSSHMAFVVTFWFAWHFACVKPNPTKEEMHLAHQLINWFGPEQTKVWKHLSDQYITTLSYCFLLLWSYLTFAPFCVRWTCVMSYFGRSKTHEQDQKSDNEGRFRIKVHTSISVVEWNLYNTWKILGIWIIHHFLTLWASSYNCLTFLSVFSRFMLVISVSMLLWVVGMDAELTPCW